MSRLTRIIFADGKPAAQCAVCGAVMDAATHREDASPKPGDTAICAYCGALHTYTDDLRLERMTANKWGSLEDSERDLILALQNEVRLRKN